jgi:hypothetical protein
MHSLLCVILTTKHRSNAGCEFSRIERFAEIVVGPDLKADDAVDVLLQRGEQNDRNMGVLGPHVPADIQARSVRQHDVEHDQFDVVRLQGSHKRALVGSQRHSKALLGQIAAKQLSNLEVIIDNQDVRFDVHLFRPSSRLCPTR